MLCMSSSVGTAILATPNMGIHRLWHMFIPKNVHVSMDLRLRDRHTNNEYTLVVKHVINEGLHYSSLKGGLSAHYLKATDVLLYLPFGGITVTNIPFSSRSAASFGAWTEGACDLITSHHHSHGVEWSRVALYEGILDCCLSVNNKSVTSIVSLTLNDYITIHNRWILRCLSHSLGYKLPNSQMNKSFQHRWIAKINTCAMVRNHLVRPHRWCVGGNLMIP